MIESIFTPRLIHILQFISQSEDYVSTSDLSKELKVSTRTISRELDGINTFLESFFIQLDIKPGKGVKLVGNPEQIAVFLKYISKRKDPFSFLDITQRRHILTSEILKYREIPKLSYFSSRFKVSEGTISRDINDLAQWFDQYNLKLERKSGVGLYLLGSEDDFRRATLDFVHERLKENDLTRYLDGSLEFDEYVYFQSLNHDSIFNLLNKEILYEVIALLKLNHRDILNDIAQSSFIGLIIHLTVAIERIEKHEYIELDNQLFKKLVNDPLYNKAKDLVEDIEESFNISFPDTEIMYILMHIKSARRRDSHKSGADLLLDQDIERLATRLVKKFSIITGSDYTNDQTLFEGLIAHLEPAINRIKFNLEIRNPYLNQIKTNYTNIYKLTETVCNAINDSIPKFSDDEIGYLAMHFGAAIERNESKLKNMTTLDIGVVCASGIGISSFLASQIKNRFPFLNKVIPISVEQVHANNYQPVDMLVTTIELNQNSVYEINISAILSDKDFIRLEKHFELIRGNKKTLSKKNTIETLDFPVINSFSIIDITASSETELWDKLLTDHFDKERIISSLIAREKLGSVLIAEKNFVLYHASVMDIEKPTIIFFKLNHSLVKDNITIDKGLLMVINKNALSSTRQTLSKLSAFILENENIANWIEKLDINTIKDTFINEIGGYKQ